MLKFLSDYILWIKALHIIAVIAWMAGMLYLPRLFVYHCEAPSGSPQSEMLKVMERKLLKIIVNPSMIKYLLDQLGFSSERSARLAYSARTPNVHGAISVDSRTVLTSAPSGGALIVTRSPR